MRATPTTRTMAMTDHREIESHGQQQQDIQSQHPDHAGRCCAQWNKDSNTLLAFCSEEHQCFVRTEDLAQQLWTKFIPHLGQTGYLRNAMDFRAWEVIQGF